MKKGKNLKVHADPRSKEKSFAGKIVIFQEEDMYALWREQPVENVIA